METYRLIARNLAVDSANKMHDDTVAKQYGFAGGLVPGADVFGYMAHQPVVAWGETWLARGAMRARFRQPVYDAEEITVTSVVADDQTLALEVHNPAGDVCASGEATLPDSPLPVPDADQWPAQPLPAARYVAEPEVVATLDRLGDWDADVDAAKGARYLDGIGESAPAFETGTIAHPGWLVRCANHVLAANVALGPWIHTASELRNHSTVRAGQRLSTRARVVAEYERKRHRFVELDVAIVVGGVVTATIHHTAIYRPAAP